MPVRACAVGGEEVGHLGLSGGQHGQGALGGAAGLVVVGALVARVSVVPCHDGHVAGGQVFVVQVLEGAGHGGAGAGFRARTLHPYPASFVAEGFIVDGVAIFLGAAACAVASIHFAVCGGGEAGGQRSAAVGARYAAHGAAGVSRQRGGHAGAEVEVAVVLVESHHAAYAASASGARYFTCGVAGDERSAVVEACHAAGSGAGSVRFHRGAADAVFQASAYVACHDGGHAVFAFHTSCHGQVLHRGVGAVLGGDGSKEALVVGLRALYVETRDGESSAVEGAGVGG